MRSWHLLRKGLGWAATLFFVTACAQLDHGGGTPSPHPSASATASALADAWHRCGATQVPPAAVLSSPALPSSLKVTYFEPITQAQADETASAFLRTIAIGRWGFEHTQLAFLRGSCLAAPLSGAEAGDISVAEQAQSMGGHAMWDPEPVFVGIAVRPVPSGLADRIQQQTAVRPDRTVVTVENSGAIWVVDTQGKKIKQIGTGAPGQRVLGVTVGTIRRDRIGERLWEQAFYRCTDPEVAGACDGIG